MKTISSALRCFPAVFAFLLLVPGIAAAQSQRASLVTSSNVQADRPLPLERGTVRSRVVSVTASALNQVQMRTPGAPASIASELVVEFFPDRTFVLEITGISEAGMGFTAYRGTVAGLPFSSATLVRNGDLVNLNVHALGRVFELRDRGRGGYEAVEIDPSVFRDHATEPIEVNADPLPKSKTEIAKDADEFIDVMIVWTPSAQTAEGGAAQMQARAVSAIATTNTAYINSGVTQRVRLVWSGMLNYTQGGMSQDLGRLASTTDGWMDEVHVIRDAVGADLVSLLSNYNTGTDGCGIAYLQQTESSGFAASGFNVTENLSCAVANLSYPHELGHNMGARHDPHVDTGTNTVNGVAAQTYVHGYVDLTNRMRTVMAYNNQCSETPNFFNCSRLPYFSNPSVNMTSPFNAVVAPSGSNPNSDNQLLLDNTRDTVQNFRQFVDQTGAGKATLLRSATTVGESGGTVVFTVARLAGSTGAASVDYATVPGTALPGTHYEHTSGTFNWAAGDTADKTITVNILQNALKEQDRTFTISLSVPSGVTITPIGTATVTVRDDDPDLWPEGACVIPAGFAAGVGPAWATASDSTSQGTCSLKSGAFTNAQTGISSMTYTGTFLAGPVNFRYRSSTHGGNNGFIRFRVDGAAVHTNGSATLGWTTHTSASLTAGAHTLTWEYEKTLPNLCNVYSSAAEGTACEDRLWIDDVIVPMNTSLTVNKTGGGAGASSVTSNVGGINCGATCSANILAGTAVTLTATPGPGAVFTGWSGGNCSGTGTCVANLTNAAATFTANFNATAPARPRDADGSGTSDIFWKDPAGQAALWLMNGTTITGSTLLLGPATGWTAINSGDFNGDARADILWIHTDGRAAMWMLDGTNVIGSGVLLGPGTGWAPTHVADFNGDARSDILWKHTDGSVSMWLMDGMTVIGSSIIFGPNAAWLVTHTADLNGDGRADLVWRNADGSVAGWLMNGVTPTTYDFIFGAGSTWQVIHAGDFDGNGSTDLLWKDGGGQLSVFLMNGLAITGSAIIYNGGAFEVTHVADFDGDNRADILFKDAGGQVALWLMNGTTVANSGILFGGGAGWLVTHTGYYDNNAMADLLWRDGGGQVALWTLNGLTVTGSALIFGGNGGWISP